MALLATYKKPTFIHGAFIPFVCLIQIGLSSLQLPKPTTASRAFPSRLIDVLRIELPDYSKSSRKSCRSAGQLWASCSDRPFCR